MLVAGCGSVEAPTLAEALVGGEWACAPEVKGDISQSERITYLASGEWRSVLNAESTTTAGERIWSEAYLTGTYTLEGNLFRATVTEAQHGKITRNGMEEVLSPADQQAIEQRFMRPRPPMTVESWSASRSDWTNGSQRFICTR
jgi:hypothetical protein